MAMGIHLQEMMQEDERATIRIEELERKLRLAESLADHVYTKYEEIAYENHEEHTQFDEVRSKIPAKCKVHFNTSKIKTRLLTRAQNLNEENQAIMNVANELQMKMLLLRDENSNMLEVAQREREKQWSNEVHQMQLVISTRRREWLSIFVVSWQSSNHQK